MPNDGPVWQNGFAQFLHSGEYADFTIICRQYSWKVHRVILGAISPYFRRLTSGNFKEALEGYADLSDEDPDIIARLITFMYFGQHPHDMEVETACAFETSLAILLTRPEDDDAASTLPLEASLITALDKYQMPDVFVNGCKASYFCMIEEGLELCLSEPMVLEFIESLRIIYQGPPSAGLRGRAITTTQYNIGALQHRRDFRQLLLAIPELALDLATKGFQQRLWCTACSAYTEFILTFEDDLMVKTTQVWDLIDYGKPLDLTKFDCRNCSVTGKCVELAKETDDG